MCPPAMNLAHDAERDLLAKVANIDVCILQSRAVVEHQEQPGERQHKKEKESDSTHAPRVSHANTRLANLNGVEVKKNTAQHDQHAFAVGVRHAHTENRSIDLTFLDVLTDSRRG